MPDTAIEHLDALISVDTTSRGSNLGVIEHVEQSLAAAGVASERLADPGGNPDKASLVARVGPDRPGGFVVCGHTDTVPVDGQDWSTDPFTLTDVGDGWLAGRGTVDMKGFIAVALDLAADMAAAPLRRPIWFALTHDEEIGCLAAPMMGAELASRSGGVDVVWVGEPTQGGIIRSHKGLNGFRTVVHGRDAHSSQPHNGASAIEAAAQVVAAIYDEAAAQRRSGLRADGFEPPYTSMNVGQITGGSAINIIPGRCEVVWEFRAIPGEDVPALRRRILDRIDRDVLPPLQAQHPGARVETEVIASSPALPATGNGEAAALIAARTGATEAAPVSFGTDGAAIQQAGLPTVIYGPGRLDQMHQPDERIERADLERCAADLRAMIAWACEPAAGPDGA